MRPGPSAKATPLISFVDELVERLARLEEQMRHVVTSVERLSNRDSELEASLRALADRFSAALDAQAATFRDSLRDVTDKFVSREDWAFWKSMLTAAMLALIAYGWSALITHAK